MTVGGGQHTASVNSQSYAVWETSFTIVLEIGAIACLVWVLYIYTVLLGGLSRGRSLDLGWFEKRCQRDVPVAPAPFGDRWAHFRDRHLKSAQAVKLAQRRLLRIASWVSLVILIAGVATAVLLGIASTHTVARESYTMTALAIGLLSPVPWLCTSVVGELLWRFRARIEWRAAVVGEQLFDAVLSADGVDQDYVARRTGLLLTWLYKRFRSGTEEYRTWAAKVQPSADLHVILRTTEDTARRRWTPWVRNWLDEVARAFTAEQTRMSSRSQTVFKPQRVRDPVALVLTATLGLLLLLGLGMLTVLFVRSGDLDLSSLPPLWDSVVGSVSTVVGIVASLVAMVRYIGRRRGGSV